MGATAAEIRSTVRLLAGVDGNSTRWSTTNIDYMILQSQREITQHVRDAGLEGFCLTFTTISVITNNHHTISAIVDEVVSVEVPVNGEYRKIDRISVAQRSDYEDGSGNVTIGSKYYVTLNNAIGIGQTSPAGDFVAFYTEINLIPRPFSNTPIRVRFHKPFGDEDAVEDGGDTSTGITGYPTAIKNYVIWSTVMKIRSAEEEDTSFAEKQYALALDGLTKWAQNLTSDRVVIRDLSYQYLDDLILPDN